MFSGPLSLPAYVPEKKFINNNNNKNSCKEHNYFILGIILGIQFKIISDVQMVKDPTSLASFILLRCSLSVRLSMN